MRVTSIDIYAFHSRTRTFKNKILTLSFKDYQSQKPYIAKEIFGLDAEEIISKYNNSSMWGDKLYNLSMKKRDITLQILLNPNPSLGKTYGMLRDELYKLIASSRIGEIQLRFNDGLTTVAAISGFVTKLESPKFTKSPEAHLTITCNDPMLKALTETHVDVTHLDGWNTIITDDNSTSPHGFKFGVIFISNRHNFIIEDHAFPTWTFTIDLTGSPFGQFVAGDVVWISSEPNNRSAVLLRSTTSGLLTDRITPESVWPILFPGENSFRIYNSKWNFITYTETFWGI